MTITNIKTKSKLRLKLLVSWVASASPGVGWGCAVRRNSLDHSYSNSYSYSQSYRLGTSLSAKIRALSSNMTFSFEKPTVMITVRVRFANRVTSVLWGILGGLNETRSSYMALVLGFGSHGFGSHGFGSHGFGGHGFGGHGFGGHGFRSHGFGGHGSRQ